MEMDRHLVALIFLAAEQSPCDWSWLALNPFFEARVIETLSNRFDGKVELGSFHVSVANGIEVSGEGLKIFGANDPNPYEPGVQALIGVQEFRFHTVCCETCFAPRCT